MQAADKRQNTGKASNGTPMQSYKVAEHFRVKKRQVIAGMTCHTEIKRDMRNQDNQKRSDVLEQDV